MFGITLSCFKIKCLPFIFSSSKIIVPVNNIYLTFFEIKNLKFYYTLRGTQLNFLKIQNLN